MKTFYFYLATIFLTLTSCTFTENLYINEDGTGKFSVDMDASGIMAMMPSDSIKSEKVVDSIFTFKQLFEDKKDSIATLPKEQQVKLKKLENFTIHTVMNPNTKEFKFSFLTNFTSVSELENAMSTLEQVQGMSKNATLDNSMLPSSFGNSNAALKYSYSDKKFTRKAILKEVSNSIKKDSLDAYKMIYESSTYILRYHFPRKVKSVSNKTALYSEDRKTITLEFPFSEYMSKPESLNFEVVFE